MSEWGNPSRLDLDTRERVGERGELKHLSTHRRRKKKIDFVSSGERKRKSPNRKKKFIRGSDYIIDSKRLVELFGKANQRR